MNTLSVRAVRMIATLSLVAIAFVFALSTFAPNALASGCWGGGCADQYYYGSGYYGNSGYYGGYYPNHGNYYGTPSCAISLTRVNTGSGYGYSGSPYNYDGSLRWSSQNAVSAVISPSIGSISPSGAQAVYLNKASYYTMTVYGYNGQTATCQSETVYPTSYSYGYGGSYYGSGYIKPHHPYYPNYSNYNYYNYGELPSCTITASPSSVGYGGGTTLSWTSYGATSAWLSDGLSGLGVNGSLWVTPGSSRTYTLTVSNAAGRASTCQTYVSVGGSYAHNYYTAPAYVQPVAAVAYVAPVVATTHVKLTQIPYTGISLGAWGDMALWLAITLVATFAAAALFVVRRREFDNLATFMLARKE